MMHTQDQSVRRHRALRAIQLMTAAALIAVPAVTLAAPNHSEAPPTDALRYARGISQAFQHVAKSTAASIVNIRAVNEPKQITQNRSNQRSPSMQDEFLRRFFNGGGSPFGQSQPQRQQPRARGGTGFIFRADGYILTNNHVVGGADKVTVTLADDREYTAEIVGADEQTDVAILRIDADDLTPATLGDSDAVQVGEWVIAVGSPFGLSQTVTAGIVSAKGRSDLGLATYEDFLQTDAAINPGNSGGPLLNLDGEIIGINTAITTRSGGSVGIGFAIPINMARFVVESLLEDGKVERGWLGVAMQPLTHELAETFEYEGDEGVLVSEVIEDSPAAKAGFKQGDIITSFNGKEMNDPNELKNQVAATKPGDRVDVEIFREGRSRQLSVKIGDRETAQTQASASTSNEWTGMGMTLTTLTEDVAHQLGYENLEGVVVTKVEPGGLVSRLMRQGDIIVELGSTRVKNIVDFRKAYEKYDLRRGVRMQIISNGARRFIVIRKR